jgi:hypothetical protein
MRFLSGRGLKWVAAIAGTGALIGAAASLVVDKRYVSTATVRIVPPQVGHYSPERAAATAAYILSSGYLAEIIRKPSLDLYRQERTRFPMEKVTEAMRTRDLRIERTTSPQPWTGQAFRISFTYSDREKARAAVREMAASVADANREWVREAHRRLARGGPAPEGDWENLQVVAPASLPERSVWPNRAFYAWCGLGVGLMTGVAAALVKRRAAWKWVAAMAGAGTLLGVTASFVVNQRYVSTATLRVPPQAVWCDLPDRTREILSEAWGRAPLTAVIQKLDLYSDDLRVMPMEDVLQTMKDRDLRIEPVGAPPPGVGEAFRIRFEYPEPAKAQMVVRELVTKCIESYAGPTPETVGPGWLMSPPHEDIEVMEEASLPEDPVGPNRWVWALWGLGAGLVVGVATAQSTVHSSKMTSTDLFS